MPSKTLLKIVSVFDLFMSVLVFIFLKDFDRAILFSLWAILLAVYALGEK